MANGRPSTAHSARAISACVPPRKVTRSPRPPPPTQAAKREFEEYRKEWEKDPRYRREDMSEQHAREARASFLRCVDSGEGAVDLAEAALWVAAEDDALVSHSAVPLPVASFQGRLQRLADDAARSTLPPLQAAGAPPHEQLEAIRRFLFVERRFSPPAFGRSNLPVASTVDNPGVWESAKLAYLHEALITRRAVPAVLAILLGDVLRRLLASGAIDFAARIDCADLGRPPRAEVLPGVTRASAVSADGRSTLNACTSGALAEALRYLKRAYWPFPWDATAGAELAGGLGGGGGGFAGAARAFLDGGADSAELEAISRAARNRLERGIFTSPGGGDLRRAVAAAERLVVLAAADAPAERRDLAVLYCHAGRLREARAELQAYSRATAEEAARRSGGGGLVLTLTPAGVSYASSHGQLPDQVLVDRLAALLRQVPLDEGAGDDEPLSVAVALGRMAQPPRPPRMLPLTW